MDGLGNWAAMPILDLMDGAYLPPEPLHLRSQPLDSIKRIKALIAKRYGITVKDLEGPSRQVRFAKPRQIAMALAYRKLRPQGYSLPMIGRHFGNRDHTTVLHACRKFGHKPQRNLGASSRWSVAPPLREVRLAA